MRVPIQEFLSTFYWLRAKLRAGADHAYFKKGAVATADHRETDFKGSWAFSSGALGEQQWYRRHEDDHLEFQAYALGALVAVMKAIRKGKIPLNHFMEQDKAGGRLLVHVENAYIVRVYPKLIGEMVRDGEFYLTREQMEDRDIGLYNRKIQRHLVRLSQTVPGPFIVGKLFEAHAVLREIPWQEDIPTHCYAPYIPRAAHICFGSYFPQLGATAI